MKKGWFSTEFNNIGSHRKSIFLMLVEFELLPYNFSAFLFFCHQWFLEEKYSDAEKVCDMVICNLVAQVFKKLERSSQYSLRYNPSNSRNAEGMSQIVISREQIAIWQTGSEKNATSLWIVLFSIYKIWRRKIINWSDVVGIFRKNQGFLRRWWKENRYCLT